MISTVFSCCCEVARCGFFNLFFYCQEIGLEVRCEVSISEMHGDASSSYWALWESHHLNSQLNQGLAAAKSEIFSRGRWALHVTTHLIELVTSCTWSKTWGNGAAYGFVLLKSLLSRCCLELCDPWGQDWALDWHLLTMSICKCTIDVKLSARLTADNSSLQWHWLCCLLLALASLSKSMRDSYSTVKSLW